MIRDRMKDSSFFCSQHFDLEKDLDPYHQWKGVARLSAGVLPTLFVCQGRTKNINGRPLSIRRRQRKDIEELIALHISNGTKTSAISTEINVAQVPEEYLKVEIRVAGCETTSQVNVQSQNSLENCKSAPGNEVNALKGKLSHEVFLPVVNQTSEYSLPLGNDNSCVSSKTKIKDDDSDCERDCKESTLADELAEEEFKNQRRKSTKYLMEKHPKLYMGVARGAFSIIQELEKRLHEILLRQEETLITVLDIVFIVLRKLKLNDPFPIIANDFGISTQVVSKLFRSVLPPMASVLREHIYWPSNESIEARLPAHFKINYSEVKYVIDCFEVRIQLPRSDSLNNEDNLLDYKNVETLKYLIAVTPDGMISHISEGFTKHAADQMAKQVSNLIGRIPPGTTVMAGSGFKELASNLAAKNSKLINPCSALDKGLATAPVVGESSRIASSHVGRVISKLRKFAFLSLHSAVDSELIVHVDDVLVCACALINL